MPMDPWTSVTRADNTYKVTGADPRRKRERKDGEEHEFSDMLKENEQETDEFKPENEEESRPNVPVRTMLDMLSAGAPPPMLNIQPIDAPDSPKPPATPGAKEDK